MFKFKENPIYLVVGLFSFILVMNSCGKDDITPTSQTTAVFNPNISYGTMKDQEGNVYKTVTIGTQIWMAENLRTTIYNDGTPIKNVTDNDKWLGGIGSAYCNYKNTIDPEFIDTYGRLYNGNSISRLAPKGWHIPTEAEWQTLIKYLGGFNIAGKKLKEAGTTHWLSYPQSTIATNESGFTALPGGCRSDFEGAFLFFGENAQFWTATQFESYCNLKWVNFNCVNDACAILTDIDSNGYSIRCVKD